MDIDERLAALTQTVELLAAFHKDGEKRMERLDRHMERLGQHMEQFAQATKGLAKRNERLEHLVTDIAEGTARLLHVAEVHEQRIGDLEGNQAPQ
jgi:ABC-type transporter Mla subunit MlaD